jgi:ATP-dependent DNA ligase
LTTKGFFGKCRFRESTLTDRAFFYQHTGHGQNALEGIVSKRKGSSYRSGRSPDWLKMKNADALAVKREEEEDWS